MDVNQNWWRNRPGRERRISFAGIELFGGTAGQRDHLHRAVMARASGSAGLAAMIRGRMRAAHPHGATAGDLIEWLEGWAA